MFLLDKEDNIEAVLAKFAESQKILQVAAGTSSARNRSRPDPVTISALQRQTTSP